MAGARGELQRAPMLVHPRFSIDLSDWLLEAALGEYSDRPTRLAA
jgi:hypothetical protein